MKSGVPGPAPPDGHTQLPAYLGEAIDALTEAVEWRARADSHAEAVEFLRRERARDRALRAEYDHLDENELLGLPKEQRSTRTRSYRQWAVTQSDLNGGDRTLLQAVLLRMSGEGDPAQARHETLARDASLSVSRTYAILRRLARRGIVSRLPPAGLGPRIAVTLDPDRGQMRALHRLWRTQPDGIIKEWEKDLPETVSRYAWTRALRDAGAETPAKGVGLALARLTKRETGLPLKATSTRELARLSGYHPDTVSKHLHYLEQAGWLHVRRPPGLGLYPRLAFPAEVSERLRRAESWEWEGLE